MKALLLGSAAIVAVGAVACGSGQQRGSGASASADKAAWSSLRLGWTSLPAPPFVRARAASVWADVGLFYWGGDTDYGGTAHADGAWYDPSTQEWTRIRPGPLSGRSSPGVVWTGTEVILWGGSPATDDGAAFNPATETWRRISAAPLSPRVPVATVWTGEEMIVWGNASRGTAATDGAAYEPESDQWRTLPRAPFALNEAQAVWTGKEMVIYGALLDRNNSSGALHARGMAYNPEEDEWRVVASESLSPQASSVAWTGKRVLAWDYGLAAGAYDPANDEWSQLPKLPLDPMECYPRSAPAARGLILAWYCGQGALYGLEGATWERIAAPPAEISAAPVSAGRVVLFPGAGHEGAANALWAYKP
jgi:hypothetical protein